MVNSKKIIAVFIGILIFLCLGFWTYLNYHYAYTLPGQPEPSIGRIYPLNVHGTIVYLTKREYSEINYLSWGMTVFIIIGILYTFFCDPFNKHKNT
jgi:hypothetical protein